jgi:sulfate-transporting ATPase
VDVLTLVVAGLLIGSLYGLLAVSVTVMYRTTGTLSFAHGGFALIAAYSYSGMACGKKVDGRCTGDAALPPIGSALLAVLLAVVVALLVERLVMRPLADAPPVNRLIASVAVLALSAGVCLQLNGPFAKSVPQRGQFLPDGGITIAHVRIDYQRMAIFGIAVVLSIVLVYILKATWLGLALRACGQAPDPARLMGVRPAHIAQFNWAVAGLVSGVAGVLIAPVNVVTSGTFAFLIIKAIGACVIARLFSLPLSLLGGLAIGVIEALVPNYTDRPGAPSLVIAVVILIAVGINRYRTGGITPPRATAITAIRRTGPIEGQVSLWLDAVRRMLAMLPGPVRLLPVLALAAFCLHNSVRAGIGLSILFYALVVLSLRVMTGLSSQPSLMQMGFVGIGAYTMLTMMGKGMPFLGAVAVAIAVGAGVGVATGIVSVYFRRLEFAIITLVLGAVLSDYVLVSGKLANNVLDPTIFGKSLLEAKTALWTMLTLALVAFVLVGRLTNSSIGTALRASAELEARVGHFSVDPRRWELAAFGLSGAVAALGGCTFALTSGQVSPAQFAPIESLTLLLAAVVAGLGSMWGCLWAGLLFGYGPQLLSNASSDTANAYPAILSSVLALFLLVRAPGGIAGLFGFAQRNLATVTVDPGHLEFRGYTIELTRHQPPRLPSETAATAAPGRSPHGGTAGTQHRYEPAELVSNGAGHSTAHAAAAALVIGDAPQDDLL